MENDKQNQTQDRIRKAAIEAIVYVSEEPVTVEQITGALPGTAPQDVRRLLQSLQEEYRQEDRGMEIREVAGGYKMFTKPEHHETIRKFVKDLTPPVKLSLAALETLATIAYRQPITLPEIQEIRGVNAVGVLKTLLDKKLITTAGRKSVIGRPILYKTSKQFLVQFGLSSLRELPSLEEFEELARAAMSESFPEAEENGEPSDLSVSSVAPEQNPPPEFPSETLEAGPSEPQDSSLSAAPAESPTPSRGKSDGA